MTLHEDKRVRPLLYVALVALFALAASCAGTPAPAKDASLTDLVVSGDLNAIKKYYANQEQLNMKDGQGLYPLHHAVVRGDTQIAEILIVLGAKPDPRDPAGKTPLRYAVDRRQAGMARMLIDRGADPFVADAAGYTPAEAALAAGADMLAAVFNAKNINNSGSDGRTVLHMAADALMVSEVGTLIELGASVQTKDKAERTALDLALLRPGEKSAAVIAEKLILKGANPSFPEFSWFATTVRSSDRQTVRFTNGNTPLHEAISRFQYGFADFLLSSGFKPDIQNSSNDASLHLTVKSGWLDGMDLLLRNGANPDIRDANGNTPLHLPTPQAVRLQATRLLLKYKADPSLQDKDGNTPLHKAVKLAYEPLIAEELIRAGSAVNAQNAEGDTPLMLCIKAGTYQYADALIAAGAGLFRRNQAGQSPLSLAVGKGVEAVDRIVLGSNVLQIDDSGNSVLSTAVGLGAVPEVVALILSKGGDPNVENNAGDNALHVAVRKNLGMQGALLIAAKANIFAKNSAKDTPVFLALSAVDGPYDWFFIPSVITARDVNGDTVGHLAARRNLADGLEYLRSKGADLESVNFARETLLHAAVKTDSAEATRYLIGNGASLRARDGNGDSPLHTAVGANAKTCMQVLILSGAELDARNFTGETPLHQAVRAKNLDFVTYLGDRGANLELRDSRGLSPLAVAAREAGTAIASYLISSGAQVDNRDQSGSTPLLYAVETGQLDLIRIFVKAKADILARNAAGTYPLVDAPKRGSTVLRELLDRDTILRSDSEGRSPLRLLMDSNAGTESLSLALAAGADPDSRDRYATTPLLAAMQKKDYDAARILLAAGADPFSPDYQGSSPFKLAMENMEVLKIFAQAAGVDAADHLGDSLLHHAVRMNRADAVALLIGMGANRELRNVTGETAFDVAKSRNDAAVLAAFGS